MAFIDFGDENLIELIKIYRDDPTLLDRQRIRLQGGLRRMDFGAPLRDDSVTAARKPPRSVSY
jgi:hypothetical protein